MSLLAKRIAYESDQDTVPGTDNKDYESLIFETDDPKKRLLFLQIKVHGSYSSS
jgi:hypothetical protein